MSNHAISVTPSVTNSTGYITGGTKTGTAVSVSASELVSGTKSISTYGTTDVTNYASASVEAGTEGTPTATKGTVSGNQVTVTPSVTNSAGYISGGTHTGTGITVSWPMVSGTFTGTTSGAAMDVIIPYTGSGYPIAVIIYPSEGCYNSNGTFYGTVNQYACVYFLALKTMPGTTPTYSTGTANNSQTINRYKSSASDATALATSSGHVNDFRDIAATAGTGSIMEIRSATKLSVFIKSSSYGFAQNVKYTYQIIYSE